MHSDTDLRLNQRAARLFDHSRQKAQDLRIEVHDDYLDDSVCVLDFGVDCRGGLEAGLVLAKICLSDAATVDLERYHPVPDLIAVSVRTDSPLAACLYSQYAGWKVTSDDYFAMGSGPIRAAIAKEEIFQEFPYREQTSTVVTVFESASLPTSSACEVMAGAVPEATDIRVAVAPTASQAGTIQVVARSVETAMHKLHEIGFPVDAVVSGAGHAPLPPVAAGDLQAIGRTNDAILYGATVNLWVDCPDHVIEQFGPLTPSCASPSHGESFVTLFERANHDFYAMDKNLFSPAVVVFHNLSSGRSFRFGRHEEGVLLASFGVSH